MLSSFQSVYFNVAILQREQEADLEEHRLLARKLTSADVQRG
jgi:hypothetical protein